MPRRGTPDYIKKMRKEGLKAQSPTPSRLSFFKTMGKRVYGTLGTIVLLLGLTPLIPQMTLTADEPVPGDIFNTPFLLHNNSFFPIYNVQATCAFRTVYKSSNIRIANLKSADYQVTVPVVDPQTPAEIRCEERWGPSGATTYADIVIGISYRPYFFFGPTRNRHYRFRTEQTKDGSLRWQETGLVQDLR